MAILISTGGGLLLIAIPALPAAPAALPDAGASTPAVASIAGQPANPAPRILLAQGANGPGDAAGERAIEPGQAVQATAQGREPASQSPSDDASLEEEQPVTPEEPEEEEPVILVTAQGSKPLKDPLVRVNEAAFSVIQDVDAALVGPIAKGYEEGLPGPLRRGLRNFFRNLLEPVNALNYLLQLKPGKAFETAGRFTLNSTLGIGGLVDIAKKEPFHLPYRRNGLANTLGYYGVGPGPFLVLPLVGATTLRDLLGSTLDQAVLPVAVGSPFDTLYYAIPAYTVSSLEYRIKFDERLTQIRESDDPYYATREIYLCLREAEIAALKNRPPPRDCSIEAIMGSVDISPPGATEEPSAGNAQSEPQAPVPLASQPPASTTAGDAGQTADAAVEVATPPSPPAGEEPTRIEAASSGADGALPAGQPHGEPPGSGHRPDPDQPEG